MSKLESFIRRMTAQRDCLNFAADAIRDIPGPVLELGLGSGRTYDHLRQILPGRKIFIFDREVKPLAPCTPPENRRFEGEVTQKLHEAVRVFSQKAALAHYDMSTSNPDTSRELAARVAPLLDALMAPDALVVSSAKLSVPRWSSLPRPEGVKPDRYFIYRVTPVPDTN